MRSRKSRPRGFYSFQSRHRSTNLDALTRTLFSDRPSTRRFCAHNAYDLFMFGNTTTNFRTEFADLPPIVATRTHALHVRTQPPLCGCWLAEQSGLFLDTHLYVYTHVIGRGSRRRQAKCRSFYHTLDGRRSIADASRRAPPERWRVASSCSSSSSDARAEINSRPGGKGRSTLTASAVGAHRLMRDVSQAGEIGLEPRGDAIINLRTCIHAGFGFGGRYATRPARIGFLPVGVGRSVDWCRSPAFARGSAIMSFIFRVGHKGLM